MLGLEVQQDQVVPEVAVVAVAPIPPIRSSRVVVVEPGESSTRSSMDHGTVKL